MQSKPASRYALRTAVTMIMLLLTSCAVHGCRVDMDDVERWETTQRGPKKLVAVMVHDKYDPKLRVAAGLALVRLKPRGGRRVGISSMVEAMADLSRDTRKVLVAGMVPTLVEEMSKPPPVAQAGQPLPPDPSIPYKDAAFALLSYDKKDKDPVVVEPEHRQVLLDALARWCVSDFEHRFDNASQMYGIEQIVRFVGAPSARLLPPLITGESRKIPELARLIAENGDTAAREDASRRIVDVVKYIDSKQWIDRLRPTVEEANRQAKLQPTPEQFEAQLVAAQDDHLKRIFAAMRKIGGRAVVEYALAYAANKQAPEERRGLATAALEGNFDRNNAEDVRKILDLAAADETPDNVRDLAFRRAGEMPRERVIHRLYSMFSNKRWQVRWVAAQYAIKMSDTSQIPEIMDQLGKGDVRNIALTEPLSYGDWMGDAKRMVVKDGKNAEDQLRAFLSDPALARRATALGYYYAHGASADLAKLVPFEADTMRIPKCSQDQKDCDWVCYAPKPGGKPDEKEQKDVSSVGEYVRFCIVPAIQERERNKQAEKSEKDQKKG